MDDRIDGGKGPHLIRSNIERIEFDYLKGLAQGSGFPVFWVLDLTDPLGLEYAAEVAPPEAIEASISNAAIHGFQPLLIVQKIIDQPYHVGEKPWKDCPANCYPIVVVTDGRLATYARIEPDGAEEALRKGLLAEQAQTVVASFLGASAECPGPIVVVVADLADELGRKAAAEVLAPEALDRALAVAAPGMRTIALWSGNPVGPSYPSAWGGEIPAGRFAVQVIASKGVLNATMAAPPAVLQPTGA
jgi:hypothetical protein